MGGDVLGYKVTQYTKKVRTNAQNIVEDDSELTLKRDLQTIVLIKNKEFNSQDIVAGLVWLGDGTKVSVSPHTSFSLKGNSYYVIDIKSNMAFIRDEETGQTNQVNKISKEEYDESGPAIVHRKCF